MNNVHPAITRALAGIAPAANDLLPLRRFVIRIGQRCAPRLEFEAMARSSFDAVQQHDQLRQDGERIDVSPVLDEAELIAADRSRNVSKAERFHEKNDAQAFELQLHRMRCLEGQ